MTVSLVVAAAKNNVIGRDGELPWHLPDDLRHFKRLTTGKPVIMGTGTTSS
jgi:dihydrofolate reductase